MPLSKQTVLDSYIDSIKKIYGSHLKEVILYGSYARGNAREDSDIDIMILLDIPDEEIKQYQEKLLDVTFDYNFDNDIEINIIAHSKKLFNKWIDAYPFFKNVRNEGVVLYGAA